MKKQFHIKAPGRDPIIIDLNANEGVHIYVASSPTAVGELKPPDFRIDGLRWAGKDHFQLGWGRGEFALNDTFTVTLIECDAPATPLEKEELYILPDKTCTFCRRKQSEVEYLVQAGYLARICDECIARCQRAIDHRKSTLNPDHIISVTRNSPWWRRKRTSKSSTPLLLEEPVVTNYVAVRDFFAVSAQGEEKTVGMRIGQPYQCSTHEWACPVALEGLYSNLKDQHGDDSFQALMLALNLARTLLRDFLEKGGSLLDARGGARIDIETLFTTGVYS